MALAAIRYMAVIMSMFINGSCCSICIWVFCVGPFCGAILVTFQVKQKSCRGSFTLIFMLLSVF